MKSIYSKPKIVRYDDPKKNWFIYFRYNKKLITYKKGLNYEKDLNKRLREFNLLRDALEKRLKAGWNPLLPDLPELGENMYFIDALNFSLEKKKPDLSAKTYSGYKGTAKFITKALKDLHWDYLHIKETRLGHIKTILQKAKETRKWSNKVYNKNLNYLKAILSELIQWEIIPLNPAHKIKMLPIEESSSNIPATPKEQQIIKNRLEKEPDFYDFVLMIYHTGIRPSEILKIQFSMINKNTRDITLPFGITKTKKERIVPINSLLWERLKNKIEQNYPDDYYLFGSFRISARGNIGKEKDFIPGPTPLKRDTATKRWEKIIKKELNINVNLYSNKHAGANAKIKAGISKDALRHLYGHGSIYMTEKYINNVNDMYKVEIEKYSTEY